MIPVFTAPKMTVVELGGQKHAFAAQSFIDQFPGIINQVFVVPDKEYDGPYFAQYCADRIRIYSEVKDNAGEDAPEGQVRLSAAIRHSIEVKNQEASHERE